ncbi:Mu transposase domain-containing protein [Streptomyces glaucescens]|uniref:Mu transposase domain-containing protein n=1 Tax=Streptomyces glaucescens TaxID=1907 RepID=UPI003BB74C51
MFTPRVDRYSQIAVRTNRYSVPVRLIGKRVRVMLHASHLVVSREECGSGPPRAADRQGQLPPGTGPLPRSPDPQARRLFRRDRA